MSIRFLFEPRDLWIGVFWDRRPDGFYLYVCPFPMLVARLIVKGPSDAEE